MNILGTLKPPAFSVFNEMRDHSDPLVGKYAGEIMNHSMRVDASLPAFPKFFALLEEFGYVPTDSTPYNSLSLTTCKGSIGLHDDPQFGLVALWLVRTSENSYPPELYAGRQWMRVDLGTVVVFNAEKPHAWLSNYISYMILQTVKRKRIRR